MLKKKSKENCYLKATRRETYDADCRGLGFSIDCIFYGERHAHQILNENSSSLKGGLSAPSRRSENTRAIFLLNEVPFLVGPRVMIRMQRDGIYSRSDLPAQAVSKYQARYGIRVMCLTHRYKQWKWKKRTEGSEIPKGR